jgi:hypothetical protein
MKMKWKRVFNNKNYNFEVDYLISAKLNGDILKMPRIYLENQDMQDSIKSSVEEVILDNFKRKEQIIKDSQNLDEKSRIKNHFRNVCYRKKFNTLQEHIKYIAQYYTVPEMTVFNYVEEDIPYIKKFSGLI